MSVHSPLGAVGAAGAVELRTPALPASRPVLEGRAGRLAVAGLLGLVTTMLAVAVSAADTSQLLPESIRPIPDWLTGPFGHAGPGLGGAGLIVALIVMFSCYAVTMRNVAALPARAVLGAIAAVLALMLLAPPLFSTDIFSYMAYGRMGTVYGANPYVLGPHAIALDPFYPYVGAKWVTIPTAYGPLFTLLSYPIAAFDVAASAIAYKLIAAASAAAVVALVWSSARIRGVDPVRAVALVGLNPLLVVYGVGGGHNDLLMLAAMAAGVHLLLVRHGRSGAASIVVATGIKLTAAIVLPFALAGHAGGRSGPRRQILAGTALASVALVAIAAIWFGTGPIHLASTLEKSQSSGDWHNIPGFISTRLGLGLIGHLTSLLLAGAFISAFAWLVLRVRRGRMHWVAGAGWATAAMLATASSLLPWYVVWLLPLAALAADKRLERVAIWITGLVMLIQLVGYLPQGGSFLGL